MGESLKMDDVFKLVHGEMEKVDDVRLFYELRRKQLKFFQKQTTHIKLLIVLTKLHLPITSAMVRFLLNKSSSHNIDSLHSLGDKHLLILKRVIGRRYEWMASPLLLDLMENIDGKKEG